MSMVLAFIKKYLFEIICGGAAVLGVLLIFLGFGAMDDVTQTMQQTSQLQNEISGMTRGGKVINRKAVDMEQERIDRIRRSYEGVMEFAKRLDEFKPLVEGAFPDADDRARLAFQAAYESEVNSWLKTLKAGSPPTSLDVSRERDLMEEEREKLKEMGLAMPTADDEKNLAPAETPEVRAAIRKARQAYIYADRASFNESPISASTGPMYDSRRPPSTEEMWDAQLEVWIQHDVVHAIARINEEAAARVKEEGEEPWVGNLPIKELISIQLTPDYIRQDTKGSSSPQSQIDRAYPPGTWEDVFTQNKSTDLYELMQFSLRMVVDARDIPMIVSGICQDRFHTPLNVRYQTFTPDTTWEGKIYGEGSLVTLSIDFETVFFSDLYLAMMPDAVLKELGKVRPTPPPPEGT